MRPKAQRPLLKKTPGDNLSDAVETHPAYGQIGASRVQGGHRLYGSDFMHHSAVRITIRGSKLMRGLSRDWHAAEDEYIEVSLSESQWAEFVSTLNSGMGTPCTVNFVRGIGELPGIEGTTDRIAQFAGEVKKDVQRSLGNLDKLLKQLDESSLGKKAKEELIMAAKLARQDIESNLPFVAKSFDEHMEQTVQRAKTEINAYANHVVTRTGIAALKGEPPLLRLLGQEEEEPEP